jgi:hypothetical protein
LSTKVFTVYCRQEFAATRVPSIGYDRTRREQLLAFEELSIWSMGYTAAEVLEESAVKAGATRRM